MKILILPAGGNVRILTTILLKQSKLFGIKVLILKDSFRELSQKFVYTFFAKKKKKFTIHIHIMSSFISRPFLSCLWFRSSFKQTLGGRIDTPAFMSVYTIYVGIFLQFIVQICKTLWEFRDMVMSLSEYVGLLCLLSSSFYLIYSAEFA